MQKITPKPYSSDSVPDLAIKTLSPKPHYTVEIDHKAVLEAPNPAQVSLEVVRSAFRCLGFGL